jgi:CubicO group peptidase (beta-lactamase class C family)
VFSRLKIKFFCALLLLLQVTLSHAETRKAPDIDRLMDEAIASRLIAGGVVLVGNRQKILYEKAYGRVSLEPEARPMTIDTIFDLASLTKVVATTPSILKLAEEGRLKLVDPVTRWFPELVGKGKNELLIVNLLTHTSGLDDFSLSSVNPLQSAIDGVAAQGLKGEIGKRFRYADINFILLGEVVHRVTGKTLDQYAANNIFQPLAMNDTEFSPDSAKAKRCAPTSASEKGQLNGRVQDYLARQLGGVAGHAGLFSTAADLSRFCRMMLEEGALDGRRVLAERTVRQMTIPYFSQNGAVLRGLGWDIASPFSSPRGKVFTRYSYGHTGYSGTSLWLDPAQDIFVVLLTSRLEYRNVREFSRLRSRLSTVAATLFATAPLMDELLDTDDSR